MPIDLLKASSPLRAFVKHRWFQFMIVLPCMVLFVLFLATGVMGTPVGNKNIMIVFVWILWWFLLISVLVPFVSRIWCTACPIPFFGEWFQRGALVDVHSFDPRTEKPLNRRTVGRNIYKGLNRKWPKVLSNLWAQNLGFLLLCTISALLLTRPIVSALALGGMGIVATACHMVFRGRSFCRYVCPVSGFLGLYSMASSLEVRSVDKDKCAKCRDKACLSGNEYGWGCPWAIYPSTLDRNNHCGLCMECIKTCTHENMTIKLRPMFSDTRFEGYDEAWKAIIMLTVAGVYSVVYLGPWGELKDWANVAESRNWLGFMTYSSALWLFALAIIPGLYGLAVWFGRHLAAGNEISFKASYVSLAYSFVPLGLLVWIAFSMVLVLVNGSYVLAVASDPFGWGWDLFGTGNSKWSPLVSTWTLVLQVVVLLIGQILALRTGYAASLRLYGTREKAWRAFAPVGVLLSGFTMVFLNLYAG